MTSTFTVRGVKIRTGSIRRFIVVAARAEDVVAERRVSVGTRTYCRVADRCFCSEGIYETRDERYTAFSEIIARSDSAETAKRRAAKYGAGVGSFVAVVDTTTGEEV